MISKCAAHAYNIEINASRHFLGELTNVHQNKDGLVALYLSTHGQVFATTFVSSSARIFSVFHDYISARFRDNGKDRTSKVVLKLAN